MIRFIKHIASAGLQRMSKLLGRWTNPFFVFLGLTLSVVLPLFFKPGFLFLLDFAPVPQSLFPEVITRSDFLFRASWWLLDLFLPGGFLQKLFLGVTFFMAGFGMFRFLAWRGTAESSSWAHYFGAFLYLFNPFVYSRILVGQWILIAAYALLPWFVQAFMEFIERPSYRGAWLTAVWWTAIFNINLHLGVISIIFPIIYVISIFFKIPTKFFTLPRLRCYLVFIVLMVIGNGYWMGPLVTGRSPVGTFVLTTISDVDIFSFFTRADPVHGVIWNTAAMYGFWADDDVRYFSQKFFAPYWFYVFFVIFGLVLWGIISSRLRRGQDKVAAIALSFSLWITLLGTGILAFYVAVGVAHPFFKSSVLWLYNHAVFLKGFREPHKFIALLVFVYCVFSAAGVADILGRLEQWQGRSWWWLKMITPGLLIVIPLMYSPGMLWGFYGQLRPADYPKSWFEVDRLLVNDQAEFKALFLPWHQYIYLAFAKTVIVNPADQFFHKPIIAGDNIEFGSIYTQSTRSESKYIEADILGSQGKFVKIKGKPPELSLGEKLNHLNIKYIIMAKESDAFNYTFVQNSPDIKLVYDSPELAVYQNLLFATETVN